MGGYFIVSDWPRPAQFWGDVAFNNVFFKYDWDNIDCNIGRVSHINVTRPMTSDLLHSFLRAKPWSNLRSLKQSNLDFLHSRVPPNLTHINLTLEFCHGNSDDFQIEKFWVCDESQDC